MSSQLRTIGIVGLICSAIVVSLVTLNLSVQGSYTRAVSSIGTQAALEDVGLPIHLTIPVIGIIDAVIEHVGVTPAGVMDAPKGPDTVAWYELGPRPGEVGSAVIDGHSGWKDNVPAVFDTIDKLRAGDKLYVKDTQGTTTIFIVREVKTYDTKADSSEVFRSSDGKAHLNLITCAGIWDPVSKSFPKRTVIFADKEE
jgi:LPXTG-site transpeptidase (sortase) family protein